MLVPHHSPYRRGLGAPLPLGLTHWPRFGVWPLLAAIAVATPVAWGCRKEARAPSTLSCSDRAESDSHVAPPCAVHDAGALRPPERIACVDAPAALESLLDAKNPLSRPYVTANVSEGAAASSPSIVASRSVGASEDGVDYKFALVRPAPEPKRSARAAPFTTQGFRSDSRGVLAVDDARALLAECVARVGTGGGDAQAITFQIWQRDLLPTAAALLLALVSVLAWMARRRVTLHSDGAGHLEIGAGVHAQQKTRLALVDIDHATITHGAWGPLSGARIELVLRTGPNVPLSDVFMPLSESRLRRFADRLNTELRGSAAK